MIAKDLMKPPILEKMEALERRLSKNHEKRPQVEEKLRNLKAGYNGEKKLQYFLSLMPDKKYHIFHDLRLPIGKSYFQIDALLLSPPLIQIIENKNYAGILFFERNQLIQEANGKKKVYQNPLTQANRHRILLNYFFEKYQIPKIPIEHLAVISNSSTTINLAAKYTEAEKRVCKADHLLGKLIEFEKYNKKTIFDQKMVGKVKRLLLNKHCPKITNVLQMFEIDKKEILPGVQCPYCAFIPMNYNRKKWICPICQCVSSDAYKSAINDYLLLINDHFTNSELRTFLQLPSPRAAAYILSLMNFPNVGENKGRIYYPPSLLDNMNPFK